MKRREFIGLVGGAAAWPVVARAQQPQSMLRIGALINYAETDPVGKSFVAGFVRRLSALGWVEGRNLIIDYRWSGGQVDLLPAYARELVALQPAAILSHTTPATVALKRETQIIPIVFVAISDPIDTGLVESLAHPGGNITGFVNIEAALAGKWLELLKEVTPRLSRVAMMFNPQTAPFARHYLAPLEKLGSLLNVKVISAPVRSETDIENVITELGREPGTGVIFINDIYSFVHRKLINSLTIANKMPGVFFIRTEDGLLSYGVNNADLFERAAGYIDRILRGEKPAELPAQVPTRYVLVVNLRTAKALGIEVPSTLLARADEVIE
jgi:putative tryptophan/tyrosine transport system substrate-binding protein